MFDKAKNKIVMLPMDTEMAIDGFVNDFHIQHYGSRIYGGVGTIIIESTAVSPDGVIQENDLGIWNDSQIQGYKHIVALAKYNKTLIGIQLNHAASNSKKDFAKSLFTKVYVSSIYTPNEHVVLATKDILDRITNDFVSAAKRAKKAGFNFVEIHAAHGYLLSQLLSPIANEINNNSDILKRAEMLIEIVKRIKSEADINIGIRLSVNDYASKGNKPKDFEPLIKFLDPYVEYWNVSTWSVPEPYKDLKQPEDRFYRLNDSILIKSFSNKKVLASGNVWSKEDVNYFLSKGIDLVGMGRELLLNPNFVVNSYLDIEELKSPNYKWNHSVYFNYSKYSEIKKEYSKAEKNAK